MDRNKYPIGSKHENKYGDVFTIVEYRSWCSIDIVFDIDMVVRTVNGKDISRKCLVPLNRKSILGVACVGVGEHSPYSDCKPTKAYRVYLHMLDRVYNKSSKDYNNYGKRGITVCNDWLNFQNFATWFYSQPGANIDGFEIDKDLSGGNKYSPEFCHLVPKEINSTFRRVTGKKNSHLPRGVSYGQSKVRPYVSTFRVDGKLVSFETVLEARKHYIENTSAKIKSICDSYGEMISPEARQLILNYNWESI